MKETHKEEIQNYFSKLTTCIEKIFPKLNKERLLYANKIFELIINNSNLENFIAIEKKLDSNDPLLGVVNRIESYTEDLKKLCLEESNNISQDSIQFLKQLINDEFKNTICKCYDNLLFNLEKIIPDEQKKIGYVYELILSISKNKDINNFFSFKNQLDKNDLSFNIVQSAEFYAKELKNICSLGNQNEISKFPAEELIKYARNKSARLNEMFKVAENLKKGEMQR